MSGQNLILSDKYREFIRHNAPVEMLEGVTAAGKTTVGIFKFMLKVAESPKKYHIIAAKDTGTAEKNIINKDLGIIDVFGILTEYNGNGTKDEKIPHIGDLESTHSDTLDGGLITKRTITADHIVAGTITANEIASATITGSKIAASTITSAKIASNAITATKIASGAITAAKIALRLQLRR